MQSDRLGLRIVLPNFELIEDMITKLPEPQFDNSRTNQPMVLHPRVVTGSGGGPDKTILNSPRFLKLYGYDSTCAYLRPAEDLGFEALRKRAKHWNAPLEEIDDGGALDWKIVPTAIKLCRRLNVKIWHGHDYKTNLLGLIVNRWHPMKLVTTVHGWVQHTSKTPFYYAIDRWAIKRYDRVLCVSPDLVETCLQCGVDKTRVQLVENAIDTEQFQRSSARAEAKQKLGLRVDQPLIGAVGRLSPEKGFDQLIRCVKRLNSQRLNNQTNQPVGLVIIGDGEESENFAAVD